MSRTMFWSHSSGYTAILRHARFAGRQGTTSFARAHAYQLLLDYKNHSLVEDFKEELSPDEPLSEEIVTTYWTMLHDHLFYDKEISWERLMMVIVVATGLAEDALKAANTARVAEVAEWTIQFFRYVLMDAWIEVSGGWNKMDEQRGDLPPAVPFPTLRRLPDPPVVKGQKAATAVIPPAANESATDTRGQEFYDEIQQRFAGKCKAGNRAGDNLSGYQTKESPIRHPQVPVHQYMPYVISGDQSSLLEN